MRITVCFVGIMIASVGIMIGCLLCGLCRVDGETNNTPILWLGCVRCELSNCGPFPQNPIVAEVLLDRRSDNCSISQEERRRLVTAMSPAAPPIGRHRHTHTSTSLIRIMKLGFPSHDAS